MNIDVDGRRVELKIDVTVRMTSARHQGVVPFGKRLAQTLGFNEPLVDGDELNSPVSSMKARPGDHSFH